MGARSRMERGHSQYAVMTEGGQGEGNDKAKVCTSCVCKRVWVVRIVSTRQNAQKGFSCRDATVRLCSSSEEHGKAQFQLGHG